MDSIASSDKTKNTLKLIDLHEPGLYVNRELGLLEFQRRVLEEALDPGNPLLDRVRFLSIVGSNIDEIFMIRVAGLKQQIAAGITAPPPDGLPPAEQLAQVRRAALDIGRAARRFLRDTLLPELAAAGVEVLDFPQLDGRQREFARRYFDEIAFPVLTPLAV